MSAGFPYVLSGDPLRVEAADRDPVLAKEEFSLNPEEHGIRRD